MPLSFPPARRPAASSARRWRTRRQNRRPAQNRPPRGRDAHEALEKLATADDIAAAVRAAGRVSPAHPDQALA